jgi:hypothetical protein
VPSVRNGGIGADFSKNSRSFMHCRPDPVEN